MSRDAACGFSFPPVNWAAAVSNGNLSPASLSQTSAAYLELMKQNKALSEASKVQYSKLNSFSNTSDPEITTNTDLVLPEIKQLNDQTALSTQSSHVIKSNSFANETDISRNVVKSFATTATSMTLHSSFCYQLPWSNLVALAANQQLAAESASRSNHSTFHKRTQNKNFKLNTINSVLGDLLPPPPSLPAITSSMQTPTSIHWPQSSQTTSRSFHFRKPSYEIENTHTSRISKDNDDTSFSDKNQPLDLSTTRRDPLDNITKRNVQKCSYVQNKITTSSLNITSSTTSTPQDANVSNDALPQISRVFSCKFQNDKRNLKRKRTSSTSPTIPHSEITSHPSVQEAGGRNFDHINTLNRDYLHKWLVAAHQHQRAGNGEQQFYPQRKRPKSGDCATKNSQKSPYDQYPTRRSSKTVNTGLTSPEGSHEVQPAAAATSGSNGKRYKRYAKPPYSYVALITLAILSSSEKKLRLSQILNRISEMFPFFKGPYQGWRDSVRHNLSQNECFVKVLKNPHRPTAKGNYWTVNTDTIPPDLMTRQNTLVARFIQDNGYTYRKSLTEAFDSKNGTIKVNIPPHLVNGNHLMEDPAIVMETLLIIPKGEEDASELDCSTNLSERSFSLADMFGNEDVIDEDVVRHPSVVNAGKFMDKSVRSRQNVVNKSLPYTYVTHLHAATSSESISSSNYVNNIESQRLVMEILRNASQVSKTPKTIQEEELPRSATIPTTSKLSSLSTTFPFILNMCNPTQLSHHKQSTSEANLKNKVKTATELQEIHHQSHDTFQYQRQHNNTQATTAKSSNVTNTTKPEIFPFSALESSVGSSLATNTAVISQGNKFGQ